MERAGRRGTWRGCWNRRSPEPELRSIPVRGAPGGGRRIRKGDVRRIVHDVLKPPLHDDSAFVDTTERGAGLQPACSANFLAGGHGSARCDKAYSLNPLRQRASARVDCLLRSAVPAPLAGRAIHPWIARSPGRSATGASSVSGSPFISAHALFRSVRLVTSTEKPSILPCGSLVWKYRGVSILQRHLRRLTRKTWRVFSGKGPIRIIYGTFRTCDESRWNIAARIRVRCNCPAWFGKRRRRNRTGASS